MTRERQGARRANQTRGGKPARSGDPPLAELAAFRERLRAFEQRIAGTAVDTELAVAVHDLQLALEEVEVADEELMLQNEELLAVREELEVQRHRYQDLFE